MKALTSLQEPRIFLLIRCRYMLESVTSMTLQSSRQTDNLTANCIKFEGQEHSDQVISILELDAARVPFLSAYYCSTRHWRWRRLKFVTVWARAWRWNKMEILWICKVISSFQILVLSIPAPDDKGLKALIAQNFRQNGKSIHGAQWMEPRKVWIWK